MNQQRIDFVAFNCEVSSIELIGDGFPVTQKGAEQWVKAMDAKRRKYTKIGRVYRQRSVR